MEIVLKSQGLVLINKYNNYYIRFIGGQYEEYPCDLLITNDEAKSIIVDPSKIKKIRDEYKKKLPWNLDTFVNFAIRDYLHYECNMSEKRIIMQMEKLDRHKDIKMEFYETIMFDGFAINSPITVEGYTAEGLNIKTKLSIIGAYNYLIYLREDKQNAINDLKRGLPIK